MLSVHSFKKLAASAALLSIAALSSPASAYQNFFGEDLSSSSSTPLGSTPNADNARSQFLNVLSGVGTENFEGFSSGTGGPLALNFPGAGTATLSGGGGNVVSQAVGTASFGRYGTSGTNFWEVAAGGSGNFVVDFSSNVGAFGFYGIDIGDFGGQLQIQLNDTANTILTVNNTVGSGGSTDGSVLFFGIVAESAAEEFTQASFLTTTGGGDVFAFDDMTVGSLAQVVPEPMTLATLGVGIAGIAAFRRYKA